MGIGIIFEVNNLAAPEELAGYALLIIKVDIATKILGGHFRAFAGTACLVGLKISEAFIGVLSEHLLALWAFTVVVTAKFGTLVIPFTGLVK